MTEHLFSAFCYDFCWTRTSERTGDSESKKPEFLLDLYIQNFALSTSVAIF